jgi:uncharacterized protein
MKMPIFLMEGCFFHLTRLLMDDLQRGDVPMITREILRQKRSAIRQIAEKWGADDIRVFGSVARGDTVESSDVDFIVRFQPDRSLLDHGGLLMELKDLLGVNVDVISETGMRDRFRKHVLKEAISL